MNYYLIPILLALIGILITIRHFNISQKNKGIDDFEKNFFAIYKNDGCVLECLILAGIINLKNDSEIKDALDRLRNRIGLHPLRIWNNDIVKIGYKKFFQRVVNGPGYNLFNKNTIQVYINSFKKNGGIVYEDDESD